MRPRWYGSMDAQRMRTSTSPVSGARTVESSSAKSDSLGKPTGRAASVTRRFDVIAISIAGRAARVFDGLCAPGTSPHELIALAQEGRATRLRLRVGRGGVGADVVTVLG